MKGISQPFKRAMSFIRSLSAIMAMPLALQRSALDALGSYESRGKGGDYSPIGRRGGHMAAVRKAKKARNRRAAR